MKSKSSSVKKSMYADFPHSTCVHIVEGIPFNVFSDVVIRWDDVYKEWVKIILKEGLE